MGQRLSALKHPVSTEGVIYSTGFSYQVQTSLDIETKVYIFWILVTNTKSVFINFTDLLAHLDHQFSIHWIRFIWFVYSYRLNPSAVNLLLTKFLFFFSNTEILHEHFKAD